MNNHSPALHLRAAGYGPAVVCLHSSGGSAGQWQALVESESQRFRVIGADFHGHGATPLPALSVDYTLATETEALARALAEHRGSIHLVGHSYGGAVALDFASRYPERVRALTLYEPVLFALLAPESAEFDEVATFGRSIGWHVGVGREEEAARRFINYWAGTNVWSKMAAAQQATAVRRIGIVARHFDALMSDPVPARRLREIRIPTLVISGQQTRRPTATISARLAELLPEASWVQIAGAGHVGPITHAPAVNALIGGQLRDHAFAAARSEWAQAA